MRFRRVGRRTCRDAPSQVCGQRFAVVHAAHQVYQSPHSRSAMFRPAPSEENSSGWRATEGC